MNELVSNKNGYLINDFDKIDQQISFTTYKLYTVYPQSDDLTEAIRYAINNKNNINSRKYFLRDLKYMKKAYNNLVIKWLENN